MKRSTTIIMIAALVFMMTSCKMKTYYQVFQAERVSGELEPRDGFLVHENGDCTVSYNFFEEGGHGGFWFTNNTDSVINIHLNETFFIVDGIANDYYKSRRWTTTSSKTLQSTKESGTKKKNNKRSLSTTEGTSSTSTNAIANEEKFIVAVPPHSTKHIYEFSINMKKFDICGLKDTPGKSKPLSKAFTEDTPFTFGNYVTYTVGNGKKKHVDDRFIINSITNINSKGMFEMVRPKDACGKAKGDKVKRIRYNEPSRFYVIYKK